jgi:hypothetical protein
MVWNDILTERMKSTSFEPLKSDPCIFIKHISGRPLIVAFYVDDGIIVSQSQEDVDWFKTPIKKHYKITEIGPLQYVLGLQLERSHGNKTYYNLSHTFYSINWKFNYKEPIDPNPNHITVNGFGI